MNEEGNTVQGTGDDEFQFVVHEGITKINVFTIAARDAAVEVVRNEQPKSYMRIQQVAYEDIRNILRRYINLLTK